MQGQNPAELYRLSLDGAVPMFIGLLRSHVEICVLVSQKANEHGDCTIQ